MNILTSCSGNGAKRGYRFSLPSVRGAADGRSKFTLKDYFFFKEQREKLILAISGKKEQEATGLKVSAHYVPEELPNLKSA